MKIRYMVMTGVIVALLSGCGEQASNNVNQVNNNVNTPITSELPNNEGEASNEAPPEANSDQILIIIDQSEKPSEANSFDFFVQKRPEGYMLSSMKWSSASSEVVNTLQEAIEHGGNGEDGFYISGNGQFMGFFYEDSLVGEEGTVSITFTNEEGQSLTWEKEITLY